MQKEVKINGKTIGEVGSVFIVGEIGFNHGGDVELAARMVKELAEIGADAVKLQSFHASELVLEKSDHFNLIRDSQLNINDYRQLIELSKELKIILFSTPFSQRDVDLLEDLDVPIYKVASMDITNFPLLQYIASTGKPIILSTGMSTLSEIGEALEVLYKYGSTDIILMHCISKYPSKSHEVNLRSISKLSHIFNLPVGYSDHTVGIWASLGAVVLGACVIEKHFTLDKKLSGADHAISADKQEMKDMICGVRTVEQMLGKGEILYGDRPDRKNAREFRRGIFARRDIQSGEIITKEMLKCVRPQEGLPPKYINLIIGRKVLKDIRKEEPILWDNIT